MKKIASTDKRNLTQSELERKQYRRRLDYARHYYSLKRLYLRRIKNGDLNPNVSFRVFYLADGKLPTTAEQKVAEINSPTGDIAIARLKWIVEQLQRQQRLNVEIDQLMKRVG